MKKFLRSVISVILCLISLASKAGAITATASGGHWGVASTWAGGVVPGPSDIAVIPAGSTVIFSESDGTPGTPGRINFNNPGTIQVYGIFNLQTSADDPVFQHVVTIDVFSGGQMQDNTAFGEMYLPEGSHLYVYSGGTYYTPFNTNFGDTNNTSNHYFLTVLPNPTVNGPFTLDITAGAVTYTNPSTPPSTGSAPTATTGAASAVTGNSATLAGTVNDNGAATTVSFRYGTDAGLAGAATVTASPSSVASGTGNKAVSANLTGLTYSTQYYYQVVAQNTSGTTNGLIQSFQTAAPPDIAPVVTITSGTTIYYVTGPGSGPVVVDPGVTVSDADNTTLPTCVVTISSGFQPGDVLSNPSSASITSFYDATSHSLLLTGISATPAQWSTALQSMTFASGAGSVVSGNRTISFVVSDGTAQSTAATKIVSVVQGLSFTGGASQSVAFCENSSAQAINNLLAVSDLVTGHTLTYRIVSVPANGVLGGFTPGTFTSNGGTLTPTGLTYTPTGGYSGTDAFTISVTNGAQTIQTVVNVTVNAKPSVNSVTGLASVCAGSTITLSSSPAGGAWSSDNTAIATVDASGVVTGRAPGTANVSYTVTNGSGCANSASASITVNAIPAAVSVITGSASVQKGQTGVAYSVTNDPKVTYSWSYAPSADVIIHGTGDAVTLDFGPAAVSGTLSVSPFSTCGIPGTASNLAITVSAPTITLSPASLDTATVGFSYNFLLHASGGTAPYSYAVTSGSLPEGMTLLSSGTLTGTASAGGTFPITITATDHSTGLFTGSQAYTLTVNAPAISLTPTTLPNATIAAVYSESVSASGGTSPYTYAVTVGSLPAGLRLTGDGTLSGTPTAGGTFTFTITATDASSGSGPYTGSQPYTLTVNAPAISLSPATLPNATIAAVYSESVTASGGTSPYTYAVTSGNLPAGLRLTGDGTLSGTPTAGGTFTFTITATDASSGSGPYTGSQPYTLTVNAPAISLSPAGLPAGSYGQAYAGATLSATSGTSPYTFAVTSGTPPPGLSLASDGSLSGTATHAGDYTFTVTATDASTGSGPYTGAIPYAIHIAPVVLTITASDQNMTYGGAIPALSVTYSGLVNGDETSSLITAATITTTATSASAVGTYPITASAAVSENYTFTYVPGTLTINPASVNVTANAQTKVYGTSDPDLDYTVTGLVNNDDASVFTGSLTRDPGENVGTYPITQGTFSVNSNYTLHFTGSLLTITNTPQQITWTQQLLSGCDDTKQLQLTGVSNSGLPLTYTSADANVATVAGDILTLVLPGSATITATQPGDDNHLAAAPIDNTVVYQSQSLVRQHWEDALFFDNTGNNYVQWQWYKNGNVVSGATGPYYNETPTLNGQYYVIATDKDGHLVQTCPLNVTGNGAVAGGIKVFPNPVNAGQSISVTCNYTATALQGAQLQVINMSGKVMQTLTNVQPSMQMTMPTAGGIYVISLVLSNGQKASVNVLVN